MATHGLRAYNARMATDPDEVIRRIWMALWLSENPAIKVVKVRMRREPRNLLSLLGGPRFSITLEYEDPATFTADVGRKAERVIRQLNRRRPSKHTVEF